MKYVYCREIIRWEDWPKYQTDGWQLMPTFTGNAAKFWEVFKRAGYVRFNTETAVDDA